MYHCQRHSTILNISREHLHRTLSSRFVGFKTCDLIFLKPCVIVDWAKFSVWAIAFVGRERVKL